MRQLFVVLLISLFALSFACRRTNSEFVTIALTDKITTLDTLTAPVVGAAAERVRTLVFNTLVRKDQNFDYIGELASEIKTSDDGKAITLVLRDNVKFQNGKDLTAADVKYTFDKLFESQSFKSKAFFDTVPLETADSKSVSSPETNSNQSDGAANKKKTKESPHISSIETPDSKTIVFNIARPSLRNQLLSNFVAIPIIPEGTAEQQKDHPVGTGPFSFVSYDSSQNIVEFQANKDYWEGSPKVQKIRIKTVTDASSLEAELRTGGVDIAPLPNNLTPDSLRSLGTDPNLKVEQFEGSNIQYLGFNTSSPPLNNVKIRQAIGYAIDREKIVKELLFGQAKVANSILPEGSWAYTPGTQYSYDPAKAKQLIKDAGYNNEPIKYKYSSGNTAVNQYSQAIQASLKDVGLNVQIEQLELATLLTQLGQGQFEMNTGIWVGGNQDPIFLKDLFTTSHIPGDGVACCNRSRYSNPQVDGLLDQAINEPDRTNAKDLYSRAWNIISSDNPLFPLWYPANMVVYNKRIGNIKISPSGDFSFVKDITLQ